MDGDSLPKGGSHSHKAPSATFGLPKGDAQPNANQFRLKGTGTFVLPECKSPQPQPAGVCSLSGTTISDCTVTDFGFSDEVHEGRPEESASAEEGREANHGSGF